MLLDIGAVPSIYRLPHIVISCENEKEEQSYSSIYGRLLIDRAVKAGLLEEETESKYIPKEDANNVEVGEYYAYPPSHHLCCMIFEMKRYRFRDVFVLVEGWMERTICRINEFDVL